MLILAILAMQAAEPASDAVLYRDCVRAAEEGVPGAIDAASRWVNEGGGIAARHCLGLAYSRAGKPAEASSAFEAAARIAEAAGATEAGALYGQAGNAAVGAGDPVRAEAMLSSAILAERRPGARGAHMVDRAAAREGAGNLAGAKADLAEGLALAPDVADGWLLAALIARREERLADARAAIARAIALAPADPDIRLEAGNMAAMDGDFDRARALWSSIVRDTPDAPAAKAADVALLRNYP